MMSTLPAGRNTRTNWTPIEPLVEFICSR
jgi:hypothetical protein